jgi:hypothetical protein
VAFYDQFVRVMLFLVKTVNWWGLLFAVWDEYHDWFRMIKVLETQFQRLNLIGKFNLNVLFCISQEKKFLLSCELIDKLIMMSNKPIKLVAQDLKLFRSLDNHCSWISFLNSQVLCIYLFLKSFRGHANKVVLSADHCSQTWFLFHSFSYLILNWYWSRTNWLLLCLRWKLKITRFDR